jgi:hypothetical protein
MAEQGSFWDTLIGGTGEGPEAGRKEKVLVHAAREHMGDSFESGELDPGDR